MEEEVIDLAAKVVEGLTREALKVAMDLGMDQVSDPNEVSNLVPAMEAGISEFNAEEAKELQSNLMLRLTVCLARVLSNRSVYCRRLVDISNLRFFSFRVSLQPWILWLRFPRFEYRGTLYVRFQGLSSLSRCSQPWPFTLG